MPTSPAEPARPHPRRLPVVLVRDGPVPQRVAAETAALAGLTVVDAGAVPVEPWDLATADTVVLAGERRTPNDSELLDVVLRGAGAIVAVPAGAPVSARLLDALQRTAPVIDWTTAPAMALDVEQVRLLHQLATGSSARAAARALHLSERTVHRRIADARDTLGSRSTNAAAADVLAIVRTWTA